MSLLYKYQPGGKYYTPPVMQSDNTRVNSPVKMPKAFTGPMEKLEQEKSLAKHLTQSGKAASFLGKKYTDQKGNPKELDELMLREIQKNPKIMSAVDKNEYKLFLERDKRVNDRQSTAYKVLNNVSAFASDPIVTGANFMKGKGALVDQAKVLGDPENPNYANYNKAVGGDGVINTGVNIFNPAAWARDASVDVDKGNYLNAGVNLVTGVVGGTGVLGIAKGAAKTLANKPLLRGAEFLTTKTPLKHAYKQIGVPNTGKTQGLLYRPSNNDITLFANPTKSEQLGMTVYDINKEGKSVGYIGGNKLSNGDFEAADVEVDPKFQKQGIAGKAYNQLNNSLTEGNKVKSWGAFVEDVSGTKPGEKLWESLEKQNLAQKNPKGIYEMIPSTFQGLPGGNNTIKAGVPKNNFQSEVNNIGSIFKKPLTDKDKEMYKWFNEQLKFDKLPETTNKQSIDVLDNFQKRIRTSEGQRRLKALGIDNDKLLQNLKIIDDDKTYGYYKGDKNKIAIHPEHPLPKKVIRHEIEHAVQSALRASNVRKAINISPIELKKAFESGTTEIDDILSGLELRREVTPNKVREGHVGTDEPVDMSNYKSIIRNRQDATDYFLTGSNGREKSAFLGEVQQYMLDNGHLKHAYDKVTPEMVKKTMANAVFDEERGGKYLRLFNIMKPNDKNYEVVSKGLNKMLGFVAPVIIGAQAINNKKN